MKKQVVEKDPIEIGRMTRQPKKKTSSITKNYPIEVPTDLYYSNPCVYRVYFGSRYLIVGGKALWQSANITALLIGKMLRTGNDDNSNFVYNAVAYIRRARILKATIKVMVALSKYDEDWLRLLKEQQLELDKAKNDVLNLNNNFTAYVPKWMGLEVKAEFKSWLSSREKPVKVAKVKKAKVAKVKPNEKKKVAKTPVKKAKAAAPKKKVVAKVKKAAPKKKK